ncbi:hypothetical protein D7V86_04650 [bacterium D16-51]|nr:hypothetical protein D7V96_05625 [bacterium D16-59]RKI61574.1 hypothetical protein D7V86_04650 [bacterium D16-51]
MDFLKAFQSVYQFPYIMCYNVLCDFVVSAPLRSAQSRYPLDILCPHFSLIRVYNTLWEDITQGKL